jgi:hypothetical protein
MFLLIICAACGFCALAAAAVLRLCLPGWKALSGLSRVGPELAANINAHSLRSGLSITFFLLAAGLWTLVFLLAFRLISAALANPLFFGLALVAFDAVLVIYRRCDKNQYSKAVHRSSRLAALAGNVLLLALCALSWKIVN